MARSESYYDLEKDKFRGDSKETTRIGVDVEATVDFQTEVALGNVPGKSLFFVNGARDNLTTNQGFVPVTNGNQAEYIFPTSMVDLEIVSDNVGDDNDVLITLLDDSFNIITETVTLNGTSPVTLVNQGYRIRTMVMLIAGSNEFNLGQIDLSNKSTGDILGSILPDINLMVQGIYTVPINTKAILRTLNISTGRAHDIFVQQTLIFPNERKVRTQSIAIYQTPFTYQAGATALNTGVDVIFKVSTETNNAVVDIIAQYLEVVE